MRVGRRYFGTSIALAIVPAAVVPALLILAGESLWPAVLSYHALCIPIPLASRCSLKEAGFVLADVRGWLPVTIALTALLVAAAVAMSQTMRLESLMPHGFEQLLVRVNPWWMFVLYSLCVNALVEEFFWRGFLLRGTGIVAGAVFFWLMHVAAVSVFVSPSDAVWFTLPAVAAAVVWGSLRQRFHTLWPAVITHVTADAAILSVVSGLRS